MGVRTRSRLPALVVVVTLLLGGAYVARTEVSTRRVRERVVVFRAEWRPVNARALTLEYGAFNSTNVDADVTTPVRRTRRVPSGEIAVLDVELPRSFDTFNFTCSIQVEREAPKRTISYGKRCRVEKYVP